MKWNAWTMVLPALALAGIGMAAAQTPPTQDSPAQAAQQQAQATKPATDAAAPGNQDQQQAQQAAQPVHPEPLPPDNRKPHVAFREECGACHIPYPARFLPKTSWKAIMANLSDHFGEDASLAEDTAAKIRQYLLSHAARWKVRKGAKAPLRISKLRWFVREHRHEVSPRRLKKAGSWSNCAACHRGAARGYFDDD